MIGDSKYELNHIYNEDCLQTMKQIPDKYFVPFRTKAKYFSDIERS